MLMLPMDINKQLGYLPQRCIVDQNTVDTAYVTPRGIQHAGKRDFRIRLNAHFL